jgi:hypothetical protein
MKHLGSLALLGMSLMLSSCGGGGGGDGGAATAPAENEHPIVVTYSSVRAGNAKAPNQPLVSVKICSPGSTTQCATIDNILLDTGSNGLRVMASAAARLNLPGISGSDGGQLAECVGFADGSAVWGSVRSADIYLANQVGQAPVLVIGDSALPAPPADCSGDIQNTPGSFGVNGVLGIGTHVADCGLACQKAAPPGAYYSCLPDGSCSPTSVPLSQQVTHPVSRFPKHNNGTLISLPAAPLEGQTSLTGKLVLGIGTLSNNEPRNVRTYASTTAAAFPAVYRGQATTAFIDSGSNALYLPDNSVTRCFFLISPFFCPSSTLSLSATHYSKSGQADTVSFGVFPALSYTSTFAVRPGLGGISPSLVSDTILYGLPFFYGRPIYTAIEGSSTTLGPGPFVAY